MGYIDMKLTDKLEGNLLSILKSVVAKLMVCFIKNLGAGYLHNV